MKGWRTLTVNAAAAVIPILELTEFSDVLPPHWLPWFVLGLAVANMGLRAITTTPLGRAQ